MKPGEFIIDGVSGNELRAIIENRPQLQMPARKKSSQDIPGRNGTLFFDEDAYENTPLELNIFMNGSTFEEAEFNRNRIVQLFDSPDYVPFIHYADPNKIYMVHCEKILFSGTIQIGYGHYVDISLTAKPFKLRHDQEVYTTTEGPFSLINPYIYKSIPIITLEGTGDCTLTVNGDTFVFKNINDVIIVDSVVEHCYKYSQNKRINENNKMFTIDFPILKEGSNTISWTGSIKKVTIEPRWQTLV